MHAYPWQNMDRNRVEDFCLFIQNLESFMITSSTKYGNETASVVPAFSMRY